MQFGILKFELLICLLSKFEIIEFRIFEFPKI